MPRSVLLTLLAGLALLAAPRFVALAEDKKADDFEKLFNGKNFTGWKFQLPKGADAEKTWTIKDGVIHCTGQPNGYFYTDKSYKDYVITYDWRYPAEQPEKTSLNSGLLVHIQEPHKVWPYCIEAQGRYQDHGKIFFVGWPKDAKKGTAKDDDAARKKALKAKEEWHTTEMTCHADGSFVVKINGIEVASGKSELTEGPIGFQSEGAAIEFRNIKLKKLK
jgi:Domain of Unknown Function (DUF1080)